MSELGGEAVIELRGDDTQLKRDIRRAGKTGGKDFSDGFEKESKGRIGKSFRDSILSSATRVNGILTAAGAVGPAVLAIGAAASAAAAGLVAVLGAIGPGLVAGGAAAVGALVAVKTAVLATKFAFTGLSAAVGGDEKALAKLSPAGRQLVSTLQGLQPGIEGIRRAVQKGLFPGVETSVTNLASAYFPLLRKAAGDLGTQLGTLAVAGTKMVTSGPWRKDFATVAASNTVNVGLFGRAGLQLADALRSLFVTAQPLITTFARFTLEAAKSVNAATQAGRASGGLQSFWARAAVTGAQLGRILGDLAVGIGNIFKIGGAGAGKSMLATVEGIAQRFRDWTASSAGFTKISAFFETGRTNLGAMSRLLTAVSTGLSDIGAGTQLAPLLDQITTKLVPPLLAILNTASVSGALSSLIDALASVAEALSSVYQTDNGLKAFSVTLGALANGAKFVVQHVPGAASAVSALLIALGAGAAFKLVGLGPLLGVVGTALGGLATRLLVAAGAATTESGAVTINTLAHQANMSLLGTWIGVKAIEIGAWLRGLPAKLADTAAMIANKAVYGVTWLVAFIAAKGLEFAAWVRSTAATVASTVASTAAAAAMAIVRGAVIAWTAAQWLLNAAMTANPIGIVIALVIAIVAALVIAYRQSETFRNVVNAAFLVVRNVVGGVMRWFSSFVPQVFNRVVTAVRTYVNTYRTAITAAFNAARAAVSAAVNAVRAAVAAAFGAVSGIVNSLRSTVSSASSSIRSAFSSVVSAAGSLLSSIKDKLGSAVSFMRGVPGKLSGAVGNLSGDLLQKGRDLIQGLITGIGQKIGEAVQKVKDGLQKIKNMLPGSPIKSGPLVSWNNGGAGKRLIDQGLISGINARTPALEASMNRAAASLAAGMGGGGSWTPPSATLGAVSPASAPVPGAAGGGGSSATINVHMPTGDPEAAASAMWTRWVLENVGG